jgi:peptide subunit release factor 1 (eRF1)
MERFDHAPVAVVLVRRGGYAVALADGSGALSASKVGTRHVQSRTAAGGWSQQRFARRRGNQADELVRAVAEHAQRLLPRGIPAGVVLGGDRALVRSVLEDDRLAFLADLPTRELYDLPDPRRSVLEEAVRRGRAVRVTIEEHG